MISYQSTYAPSFQQGQGVQGLFGSGSNNFATVGQSAPGYAPKASGVMNKVAGTEGSIGLTGNFAPSVTQAWDTPARPIIGYQYEKRNGGTLLKDFAENPFTAMGKHVAGSYGTAIYGDPAWKNPLDPLTNSTLGYRNPLNNMGYTGNAHTKLTPGGSNGGYINSYSAGPQGVFEKIQRGTDNEIVQGVSQWDGVKSSFDQAAQGLTNAYANPEFARTQSSSLQEQQNWLANAYNQLVQRALSNFAL